MVEAEEFIQRNKNAVPVSVEDIKARWSEQGYSFKKTSDDPGRVWHWETHEAEQVAAIVKGKLRMDLEHGSIELEAGDEAFIPKGAWHRANNPYRETCEWVYGYRSFGTGLTWPVAGAKSDLAEQSTRAAPACLRQVGCVPRALTIMVSGPYNADTQLKRQRNLDSLNRMALRVHQKGHLPLVGVTIALSFLAHAKNGANAPDNDTIMAVSMGLIHHCDAVLQTARSPGADCEVAAFKALGKPVLTSLEQLTQVQQV